MYLPGGAIMHACVIHGSGLTSLHPTASASLSDGSAVLQQLCADYPSYSPGGTTVHRHVNNVNEIKKIHMSHGGAQWCHWANTMDNLRTAVVKQLNRQKVTCNL